MPDEGCRMSDDRWIFDEPSNWRTVESKENSW